MATYSKLFVIFVVFVIFVLMPSSRSVAAAAQAVQPPVVVPPPLTPEQIVALGAGMPEGSGKDVTVRTCGQCHEPQRVAALRLTRDGWDEVIAKMAGLGAKATDAEFTQILDYLSEHYKGEAPKPINLNTASAIDLESVAGLLRKEAAAWIKYRNERGFCKTLDDLKKVAGLPFKKIDTRRDRLVCF
jgi:competence protein ComEA